MWAYKILLSAIFLVFATCSYAAFCDDIDCDDGDASTWCIITTDQLFDGDTDCGGSCDGSDTLYICGGTRNDLMLQDLDGNGTYITITNENADPDNRVIMNSDLYGGTGVISLYNVKYVDLRGDGDPDITYGIKTNGLAQDISLKVYGQSRYVKISYIEHDGSSWGTGFQIQDAGLTNTWVFTDFEIHNNYIHDNGYAGMYIGHNEPQTAPYTPTIANFSIHDNLLENIGAYGINGKGTEPGTTINVYNNTIKTTGVTYTAAQDAWHGLGPSWLQYDTTYNIYGNYIEGTKGPCVRARQVLGAATLNIYNNTLVNCGTGNEEFYGHGVAVHSSAGDIEVYDNIIIQPTRYGLWKRDTDTVYHNCDRNIICDAGLGELYSSYWVEGTGGDENTYEADCANVGFCIWSDDSIYSNDDFSLDCEYGGISWN